MSARRTSAARVASCLLALALAAPSAGAQGNPDCAPDVIFSSRSLSNVGAVQRHVEAADLNGDFILDLVISSPSSIIIALGAAEPLGQFTYTPSSQLFGYSDPTGTAIADFNGDGIKDIAVACDGSSGGLFLLRGHGSNGVGNGQFEQYASLPTGNVWDVAAVDLNEDGILDIVAGGRYQVFHSFLGNGSNGQGDGSFTRVSVVNVPVSCKGLDVADVDLDGILDVVVAGETITFAVLRGGGTDGVGNGTFTFWFADGRSGSCFDVTVADFDRDGFPDIATANYDFHSISVYRGPNFTSNSVLAHPTPGYPIGITAKDFDDDTFPDLVVPAAGSSATFVYFRNSGQFTAASPDGFSTFVPYGGPSIAYNITTADVDVDGDFDVLVPALGQNTLLAAFNLCNNLGLKFLTTQVVGAGSVTRSPDEPAYPIDTVVELTAHPSPNWEFLQWSGSATGSENPISITMDANKFVIATFARIQTTLAVTVAGPGQGSVSRSPNLPTYDQGTSVRLTATPLPGNAFDSWSGDATGSANPLDLLMDANKSVTARFRTDTTVAARMVSVTDVPLDQGGAVKLRWHASPLETPGVDPELLVTRYLVWRQIPAEVFEAARAAAAPGEPAASSRFYRNSPAGLDQYWELLADLPAGGFSGYSYVATTPRDSTAAGNPLTSYLVQARNNASTRWFDSAADSGYSVDNLPPSTPGPVFALFGPTEKQFHWGPSRAPDLYSYRMHRGTSRTFVPGPDNLIAEPTDTTFVDVVPLSFYYKLAAVDIHGNLSHYVLIVPDGPVATLASLVTADAGPDRIALLWFVTQPGLAATVYRRTDATDWLAVSQRYADGQGYLRYEDTDVQRGSRYGYRLGIFDGGEEAYFAEHWVQADDLRFALERVIPNPSPGGVLNVDLVVPDDSPATLELLDVSGRRLGARHLAGQAGRQRVALRAGAPLPSGLYFVRLRHAGREQSLRAVVVE